MKLYLPFHWLPSYFQVVIFNLCASCFKVYLFCINSASAINSAILIFSTSALSSLEVWLLFADWSWWIFADWSNRWCSTSYRHIWEFRADSCFPSCLNIFHLTMDLLFECTQIVLYIIKPLLICFLCIRLQYGILFLIHFKHHLENVMKLLHLVSNRF